MSQSKLYRHYREQLESFQQHFRETTERTEVEDIHQLRVDIKKIRALLSLMEIVSCGGFRKKKHLKLFSGLFSNAGALREIQVNQSTLDDLNLQQSCSDELCQSAILLYGEDLSRQGALEIGYLTKALATFNWRKLNKLNRGLKESINGLVDAKIVEESIIFIEKQIARIHKLRNRFDSDKGLHKIRAHLKSITEIYRLNNRIAQDEALQKKIESLKRLEKFIGKWHDYTVLICSIEQFSHNEKGGQLITPLKRIVADIRGINGEIRGRIIAQIDEIF